MNKKILTKYLSLVTMLTVTLLSRIMVNADIIPEPDIVEQVSNATSGLGLWLLIVIILAAIGIIVFIRRKK